MNTSLSKIFIGCCFIFFIQNNTIAQTDVSFDSLSISASNSIEQLSVVDSSILLHFIQPSLLDCAHGHMCCQVECPCCTDGILRHKDKRKNKERSENATKQIQYKVWGLKIEIL
ncbi:MAG: hypothetical protein ACPG4Z_00235 [Chitinophagales bacterium]